MDDRYRRPFGCDQCELSFTSKQFLQRHLFVHIDERIYKCHICLKTYKYRKGLNRHYRKLHYQFYSKHIWNQPEPKDNKETKEKKPEKAGTKTKNNHEAPRKKFKKAIDQDEEIRKSQSEITAQEILIRNDSKIFVTSPFPLG